MAKHKVLITGPSAKECAIVASQAVFYFNRRGVRAALCDFSKISLDAANELMRAAELAIIINDPDVEVNVQNNRIIHRADPKDIVNLSILLYTDMQSYLARQAYYCEPDASEILKSKIGWYERSERMIFQSRFHRVIPTCGQNGLLLASGKSVKLIERLRAGVLGL